MSECEGCCHCRAVSHVNDCSAALAASQADFANSCDVGRRLEAALAASQAENETTLRQHGDLCGQIGDLRAEVSRLTGELAAMTQRERVAWAEIHVQASRNQRLTEDVVNGTSNINRQLIADRDRLEAALEQEKASHGDRGSISRELPGVRKG